MSLYGKYLNGIDLVTIYQSVYPLFIHSFSIGDQKQIKKIRSAFFPSESTLVVVVFFFLSQFSSVSKLLLKGLGLSGVTNQSFLSGFFSSSSSSFFGFVLGRNEPKGNNEQKREVLTEKVHFIFIYYFGSPFLFLLWFL